MGLFTELIRKFAGEVDETVLKDVLYRQIDLSRHMPVDDYMQAWGKLLESRQAAGEPEEPVKSMMSLLYGATKDRVEGNWWDKAGTQAPRLAPTDPTPYDDIIAEAENRMLAHVRSIPEPDNEFMRYMEEYRGELAASREGRQFGELPPEPTVAETATVGQFHPHIISSTGVPLPTTELNPNRVRMPMTSEFAVLSSDVPSAHGTENFISNAIERIHRDLMENRSAESVMESETLKPLQALFGDDGALTKIMNPDTKLRGKFGTNALEKLLVDAGVPTRIVAKAGVPVEQEPSDEFRQLVRRANRLGVEPPRFDPLRAYRDKLAGVVIDWLGTPGEGGPLQRAFKDYDAIRGVRLKQVGIRVMPPPDDVQTIAPPMIGLLNDVFEKIRGSVPGLRREEVFSGEGGAAADLLRPPGFAAPKAPVLDLHLKAPQDRFLAPLDSPQLGVRFERKYNPGTLVKLTRKVQMLADVYGEDVHDRQYMVVDELAAFTPSRAKGPQFQHIAVLAPIDMDMQTPDLMSKFLYLPMAPKSSKARGFTQLFEPAGKVGIFPTATERATETGMSITPNTWEGQARNLSKLLQDTLLRSRATDIGRTGENLFVIMERGDTGRIARITADRNDAVQAALDGHFMTELRVGQPMAWENFAGMSAEDTRLAVSLQGRLKTATQMLGLQNMQDLMVTTGAAVRGDRKAFESLLDSYMVAKGENRDRMIETLTRQGPTQRIGTKGSPFGLKQGTVTVSLVNNTTSARELVGAIPQEMVEAGALDFVDKMKAEYAAKVLGGEYGPTTTSIAMKLAKQDILPNLTEIRAKARAALDSTSDKVIETSPFYSVIDEWRGVNRKTDPRRAMSERRAFVQGMAQEQGTAGVFASFFDSVKAKWEKKGWTQVEMDVPQLSADEMPNVTLKGFPPGQTRLRTIRVSMNEEQVGMFLNKEEVVNVWEDMVNMFYRDPEAPGPCDIGDLE